MTKLRFTLQAAALVVFTLAFTSFAQAQASRTWVSGVGDDVNPCRRTAPCNTYAGAFSIHRVVADLYLESGGFGTTTVTESQALEIWGTLASTYASGTRDADFRFESGSFGTTTAAKRQTLKGSSTPVSTHAYGNHDASLGDTTNVVVNNTQRGLTAAQPWRAKFLTPRCGRPSTVGDPTLSRTLQG